MTLDEKFDDGTIYSFECETRVNNNVPKDEKIPTNVHVDLSGATAKDALNKDFAVKIQDAYRKSFETQDAFKRWAEKRNHEVTRHVSVLGHKIESVEQLKAQIRAQIAQLPKEERKAELEKMEDLI